MRRWFEVLLVVVCGLVFAYMVGGCAAPETEADVCAEGQGKGWNDGGGHKYGYHVVAHKGTEEVTLQAAWAWYRATQGQVVWYITYTTDTHLESGKLHVVRCEQDSPALGPHYWGVTRADSDMPTIALSEEVADGGSRAERGAITMAHELGHAMGLDHNSDPHSLMYYTTLQVSTPLADPQTLAQWGALD